MALLKSISKCQAWMLVLGILWVSCTQSTGAGTSQVEANALPAPNAAATTWVLKWSDEFNGTSIDTTKWTVQTGAMGVGGEEEYYLANNVTVANGELTLTALKQKYRNKTCTSGRIQTKATFGLGRWEARIKLPWGQGSFPAFWTLTQRYNKGYYGEIDILELWGAAADSVDAADNGKIWSTVHRAADGSLATEASYQLPGGAWFRDDYHIFAMEKDLSTVKFYVDGILFQTVAVGVGNGWENITTEPAWTIFDMAVINSDATTPWPMTMKVDYVRYYQQQ